METINSMLPQDSQQQLVYFSSKTTPKAILTPRVWQRCQKQKKLRSRGGFEAGSPLSHMNRHKHEYAGNNQNRNQTLERKNPCKLNNQ
jgi:hypothetical protein